MLYVGIVITLTIKFVLYMQITCFDSNEFKPGVTSVLALPDPLRQVLVNTSETLKLLDLRSQLVANEYKIAVGPSAGGIR